MQAPYIFPIYINCDIKSSIEVRGIYPEAKEIINEHNC